MRILPREHGATVIWLCSFILALTTLTETPDLAGLALFIVAAILALVALARLTGSSAKLMRLERHRVLLPVMSGLLTLFVPVGHLIMLRQLPAETVAVWVVFLTYTVAGVVYTRITVRAFLKMQAPAITAIMASAAIAILIELPRRPRVSR